ncbi:hypothetical protein SPM83_10250, partial [Enterobacter hormaechei subsp. xiangfangensis]
MSNNGSSPLVLWYNQLGMNDVDRVGGKNASLGEMITNLSGMGVSVPKEGANKQVISSQADSLIKISRIWADFFPANTS